MAVHLVGSVLLGALLAAVGGPRAAPPWVGRLLGTGFLGGFTTSSAHALDIGLLLASDRAVSAVALLVLTLVAAVAGRPGSRGRGTPDLPLEWGEAVVTEEL